MTQANTSPPPAHLDFREFVDVLRKDGDLADINVEVDPHLEIGAITRRVYEQRSKAPLFNNVKGMHNGLFRVLGAQGGLSRNPNETYRRMARHIGLPPTASLKDIIDRMLEAKIKAPLKPVHVETGPCKEVKILGDDVDLTKLPVPFMNRGDGGKYIQTMGVNIVGHPTEDWTNWSIARAMVHDKTRMAGLIIQPQHIAQIYKQWQETGRDMPFAIAQGAPPIATMVASMPLPEGVSEAEYVGALCGSPIKLVKCETNDLYVPANSEIVLEGTVSVKDWDKEGPFGEMIGYCFTDHERTQPLYKVNAITYRKDPILTISVPGRATGVDETHTLIGTLESAEIRQLLQEKGFPVKEAWVLFESQVSWVAIQVDKQKLKALHTNAKDFSQKIGNVVFREKAGRQIHRVLLVGDEINPFSFEDVMWAYSTRCQPGVDDLPFEDVDAFPLMPFISHGATKKMTGSKVVSNCLLPGEYIGEEPWIICDFEHGYPQDVKEKVIDRWGSYGLD